MKYATILILIPFFPLAQKTVPEPPEMVIQWDTMHQTIIWHEGSLTCIHDWVYKPGPLNLYETSNNKSIERICRDCLQYEQYIRRIRYKMIKPEETDFYKLKELIGQN